SLFGLVAPAGQTAYAASKFALRGFSEALRHELLDGGPSVTTVHPAGTHTHMVCHSSTPDNTYTNNVSRRYETLLTSSPEDAASDILRAVETRKARLLIGPDAHHADWLQRFVPHNYWTWMKPRQALRCE
ncbi:MAG: SDR family NAD(P)-dependent oxidoreductase, partial [Pseudomonadota bacterium]